MRTYKGLRVSAVSRAGGGPGEFEIVVDGDEYVDSALPMTIPSGPWDADLAPAAPTDFRSVAGCIGYVVSFFRPDLSRDASLLSRTFTRPTVNDAVKENATLE
jgi:hypothetical protein